MSSSNRVIVFLGPSLPWSDGRQILPADYRPPASMGSIYSILTANLETIVLIDGVFHGVPSVWHREILDALNEGVGVFGASSMGALRAAELHPFGMVGKGKVFEWYRDGVIDGDDEVALMHGSREDGFRALSEPLVNIRWALSAAVNDGCIVQEQADELVAYSKNLYYPKRSFRELLTSPVLADWRPDAVKRLRHYLANERIDLKRDDAVEVLRHCAGAQNRVRARDDREALWPKSVYWELGRVLRAPHQSDGATVTGDQILREARKDAALIREMWRLLAARRFVLEWARENEFICPQKVLQAAVEQHRPMTPNEREDNWMCANGLLPGIYAKLMADRALVAWLLETGAGRLGIATAEVPDSISTGTPQGVEPPTSLHDEFPDAPTWPFLEHWARDNGIRCDARFREDFAGRQQQNPRLSREDEERLALVEWMLMQGPEHFGLAWSFDAALLGELQVTGEAAKLGRRLTRTEKR